MEQYFCIAILELKISKVEFLDLTPYEFSCLVDFQRQKQKDDYEILRNVIYNAGLNLLRKKGQSEVKLFDDKQEAVNVDVDKARKERGELFGHE